MKLRDGLLLATLAGILGGDRPAAAYVQAVTKSGEAWHWNHTDLSLEAHVGNSMPALDSDQLLAAIRAAAAPWTHDELACSAVTIQVNGVLQGEAPTGHDGINRLVFRRKQWCPDPQGPDEPCYTPQMLAVTTDTVNPKTGEIVEADMEVNALDYVWSDLVARPGAVRGARDLQNTLTHEFGHFIGFGHSCILSKDEPVRFDDRGNPVPMCGSESAEAHDSTLVAQIESPQDVERRTLTEDDQRGVCDVYPVPIVRGQTENEAGGCAVAGRGRPGLWLLLAAAIIWRRGRRATA